MLTLFRNRPSIHTPTRTHSRPADAPALLAGEHALFALCLVLLVVALAGPSVAQDAHYHRFADQRAFAGLPHAMDVLSNLLFAVFGAWGIARVLRGVGETPRDGASSLAMLFFLGLLTTTVGSSAYHWRPDDAGLMWDRIGMVPAFAGLIGLAAATRISMRAGFGMAALVMATGPAAAWWCLQTGNLLPWAVVQGGGIALVVCLAFLRVRPGVLDVPLGLVIGLYAVAKALELLDAQVFAWTGTLCSGHSLKHLVAACAALPVLAALRDRPVR